VGSSESAAFHGAQSKSPHLIPVVLYNFFSKLLLTLVKPTLLELQNVFPYTTIKQTMTQGNSRFRLSDLDWSLV
jgi:hypothetical protein